MNEMIVNDGHSSELSHLRAELARARAMLELVMEHNPDGIAILQADGAVTVNPAGARMTPGGIEAGASQSKAEWTTVYGFFEADRVTPLPIERLGSMRAMRGESVRDEVIFMRGANFPEGLLLNCTSQPLPGGGSITVFRDVTEQARLEADLARQNASLAARDAENRQLIDRLRVALDDLSTPVLEVGEDVLVLPVIGLVDTQRSAQMSERLLAEVVRTRSRHVIVDLTGVELIDTGTADRFAKLARAVELLGARCILSGLQPAVAQTLVELGIHFGGLETQRNLRHALEAVEGGRRTRERVVQKRRADSAAP
jgi:rsbT co-antagonist protein RsbR